MERAELGIDGNCGFALLGENLQTGEAEFIKIELPIERSKNPNRYNDSEWCKAACYAASRAYVNLKKRLLNKTFSFYLGSSHPNHI